MLESQEMKSSNQRTSSELDLLQREARKRIKRDEDALYEEVLNGIIIDPLPYKIKTAQFHYGGPGSQYPIWAVTRPGKKSGRKREVFLISTEYFKKYPGCCSPLASGTEEIFLKSALYPMFQKRNAIKDMTLQ